MHFKAVEESRKECIGSDMHTDLYLHVFAPVMITYVEWVLREAAASGKKRLYFLARDGYPMYLAAKEICEKRHMEMDCRYLKLSRYSMRVPSYELMKEACLERICIDGMEVTFSTIMKRAALTEKEERTLARLLGYEERLHKSLQRAEILKLKKELYDTPFFFEWTYAHSKEAYENTMGYLKQEGLLEEVPYALVDSGWTGTLQQTLKILLTSKKPAIELEGYYFGLYELPAGEQIGYHAFYFTPEHGLRRKAHFSNCLFECVFSAPGGMTLGYQKLGEVYVPVEGKENPNKEQMEWNAAVLKTYVRQYLKAALLPKQPVVCETQSGFVELLLSRFMGRPEKFEVDIYGEYLFSDDVLEGGFQEAAKELSEVQIRQQDLFYRIFVKLGVIKGALAESAWMEGSIVRGGRQVKKYLRHVFCYRYFIYIRKTWKGVRNARFRKKK